MRNSYKSPLLLALILPFSFSLVFIAGCANDSVKKDLNQKVALESDIKTRSDVRAESEESEEMIENSTDLTSLQRSQLVELKNKTIRQIDALETQSNQLRAALIDVVASPNYDTREVKLAKSRIRKLENEKLEVSFSAVDDANKILGHQAPQHRKLFKHFLK